MATSKKNQPLNDRIPVTNMDGTPTQYLIRLLQDKGLIVDEKISNDDLTEALEALTLDDLADVDLSTPPTAGQVLLYDDVDAKWKAGNQSGGGGGGGGVIPVVKPTLSVFPVQRLRVDASLADIYDGIRLVSKTTNTNTNEINYVAVPISAGPNGWRATTRLRRHTPLTEWAMTGMLLRDSASGQSILYCHGRDGTSGFIRNTFSSDTAWSSVEVVVGGWETMDWWMRIEQDLTTRRVFVSVDGDFWQQIYSETATEFITPDQVGVVVNPNMGYYYSSNLQLVDMALDCLSWEFEQL